MKTSNANEHANRECKTTSKHPIGEVRRWALVAILATSAAITLLSSGISQIRDAPDERHHYSRIQFAANHPFEFPPQLENIRTDNGEANHLTHPPLYYTVMAPAFRLLRLDRHIPGVLAEIDQGGLISSHTAIRPLRNISMAISLAQLVGIYLLTTSMWIRAWFSTANGLLFALFASLPASHTYIAGMLNNDVIGLIIWPYILLNIVTFAERRTAINIWWLVLLTNLLVLNKATLWPLALSVAVGLVVLLVREAWNRGTAFSGIKSFTPQYVCRLRPVDSLVFLGAIAASIATSIYLIVTYTRYGAIQPSYVKVLGLDPSQSRFYVGEPTRYTGRFELALEKMDRLARSLFGILDHSDRLYFTAPRIVLLLAGAVSIIGILIAVRRCLTDRSACNRFSISLWSIATGVAYFFFFSFRGHSSYMQSGHFAAAGRYMVGYYGIWVFGITLALSFLFSRNPRIGSRLGGGIFVVAWLSILLWTQPFIYLVRTGSIADGTLIVEQLSSEAQRRGFDEVAIDPVSPVRFVEMGVQRSGNLQMGWSDSSARLIGKELVSDCSEWWVLVRGDTAFGELSKLRVDVEAPNQLSFHSRVQLVDYREVLSIHVREMPFEYDSLRITLLNHQIDSGLVRDQLVPWLPHSSVTRIPIVERAWSRSVVCDELFVSSHG